MRYGSVKSAVQVHCEAVARTDVVFTWLWLMTSPYFYSLPRAVLPKNLNYYKNETKLPISW